jgi:hypothetical protein
MLVPRKRCFAFVRFTGAAFVAIRGCTTVIRFIHKSSFREWRITKNVATFKKMILAKVLVCMGQNDEDDNNMPSYVMPDSGYYKTVTDATSLAFEQHTIAPNNDSIPTEFVATDASVYII